MGRCLRADPRYLSSTWVGAVAPAIGFPRVLVLPRSVWIGRCGRAPVVRFGGMAPEHMPVCVIAKMVKTWVRGVLYQSPKGQLPPLPHGLAGATDSRQQLVDPRRLAHLHRS